MFDEPQARQCSEYEDKGYQCVPYYTCDECNTIIIDGAGLFDERNTVDKCKTSRKILLSFWAKRSRITIRFFSEIQV